MQIVIRLLFALFISSIAVATDRPFYSCDTHKVAEQIHAGQSVLPDHLYHYGPKEFLLKDVASHTVPQDDWFNFIMGANGSSRYQLKDFRRGLYGTIGLNRNFFFDQKNNWVIRINLKPECLEPQNVATFIDVDKDPRFVQSFMDISNGRFGSDPSKFIQDCYGGKRSPMYFGPIHAVRYGDSPDSDCEKTLSNYLAKFKFKIVQDYVIQTSYYIRDRSCIQDIKGTPFDIIEMLANEDDMWSTPCPEEGLDIYDLFSNENRSDQELHNIPDLLLGALASLNEPISAETYQALEKRIAEAHWELVYVSRIRTMLLLYLKNRKACEEKGRLKEFQEATDKYKMNCSF
jgi:hypothetical protein